MEDVVVVGAGQAGLATSHELSARGVSHTVLERGRVGESWRGRWRSFCLVTPNWSMRLPGMPYDGDDPDAFEPRDEIVAFLERYARASDAPLQEGVAVDAVDPLPGGGFRLATSRGELQTRRLVLCAGAYRKPHRPAAAAELPAGLLQIDIGEYEDPASLPEGPVMVVGSGQSGCQIAEELNQSGRDVLLACGRAPWAPRRIDDRDLFWWLEESGYLAAPVSSLPDPSARLFGNILASGHGGGHDLHLRTLAAEGVRLAGHFEGVKGRHACFLPDLPQSLAWGDARYNQLQDVFAEFARERGLPAPPMLDPRPLAGGRPPELVDLRGFGAAIFAGGFRPDYASWVNVPGGFDELGFPHHDEGESTAAPGLHFVGVHFLRTRKSALFIGVGDDATVIADSIASNLCAGS